VQQIRLVSVFGWILILFGFGCSTAPEEAAGIIWQSYEPSLLAQAKEDGRPVMINFHADWCVPCLELEKYTLSDESVVEASQAFLPLVVDWTEFESVDGTLPGEAGALQTQFRVMGLPTILFLDSTGTEVREARVFGFLDPEDFVLQAALAANPG